MAPEILLKQGHGKEADWWSLGILIYEMLVGLPPFYQENTKKAYEALLTQPIEFPSNISSEARRMVRGLLNVDSSKRLGREDVTDEQVGYDATSIEKKWKNVSWLEPVRWHKLLAMEEEPPFKPRVRDITDVKNFSPNFTVDFSHISADAEIKTVPKANDVFSDFQYVAPVWTVLSSPELHPPVNKFFSEASSPGTQHDDFMPPSLDLDNRSTLSESSTKPSEGGAGGAGAAKLKDVKFCKLATGREAMSEVPKTVSDQLNKLMEKNKLLYQHIGKEMADPAFRAMTAKATELCFECKWDMRLVANLICDSVAEKDNIDNCFTPKGAEHVAREQQRLKELREAFQKICLRLDDKRKELCGSLQSQGSEDEESLSSVGAVRVRTSSQGSKSSCNCTVLEAFESEAQAILKEVVAQQAEFEADAERRKFELPGKESAESLDVLAPLPSLHPTAVKRAGGKRNGSRVHSENDLALWLKQQAELVEEASPLELGDHVTGK
uniref:Protein kinase domain-containing protein n=1 Tax=Guillardia theta TaxID=55529 RepID=A0A7S4PE11_GUITH